MQWGFLLAGKKTAGLYLICRSWVTWTAGAAPRTRTGWAVELSLPMCQAASAAAVLVSSPDSTPQAECLLLGWRWHWLPSCVWLNTARHTCTHTSTFTAKTFRFWALLVSFSLILKGDIHILLFFIFNEKHYTVLLLKHCVLYSHVHYVCLM